MKMEGGNDDAHRWRRRRVPHGARTRRRVIRPLRNEILPKALKTVCEAVVQHRVALLVLNVDVRASPEEGLHDTLVALLGGQQQQRVAVLVLDINEYLKIAPTGRV